MIILTPASQSAWILAADNPDLVSNHATPLSQPEAMSSPDAVHWGVAIDDELKSLDDNKVWRLIVLSELPPGAKLIPCK